jgi:hypothetical protein
MGSRLEQAQEVLEIVEGDDFDGPPPASRPSGVEELAWRRFGDGGLPGIVEDHFDELQR